MAGIERIKDTYIYLGIFGELEKKKKKEKT